MGVTTAGKASKRLVDVKDSNLNEVDDFPVGQLLKVAEAGGLTTRPGKSNGPKGAAQAKPARTLCEADFELAPSALQDRANSIARACGGGPLVGRVRSAGEFKGGSTTSYQDWWEKAEPKLRALSLSEGKRYSSFTPEMVSKLKDLQCPFRGTLEFVVAEEESDEEQAPPPKSSPRNGNKPAAK